MLYDKNMKKFFLSLTIILAFIFYSLHQRLEASDKILVSPNVSSTPTATAGQVSTAPTTSQPSIAPTSEIKNLPPTVQPISGQYKNGEYIGDATDAYYGNVQVKAVINDGKISDVQFLQFPSDRRTSIEINTQAMPFLKQEAIQAQNANVDIVSGATATSRAFMESLHSALTRAQS